MSEINIERLKVDADYWDEIWNRLALWQQSQVNTILGIPRPPKKAQEVEWDGESAPAPQEIAQTSGGKCQVLGWDAQRAKVAVQWHDGELGVVSIEALKPIRTKQQCLRDELASMCDEYIKSDDYGHNLADAILSRYNLEPKQ